MEEFRDKIPNLYTIIKYHSVESRFVKNKESTVLEKESNKQH